MKIIIDIPEVFYEYCKSQEDVNKYKMICEILTEEGEYV